MENCRVPLPVTKKLRTSAIPEHLDRCLPVTDKGKSAWQKCPIRCKGGRWKSVCRELTRRALAVPVGAPVLSAYESLRAGVALSFGAHSDANQMLTECVAKLTGRRFSEPV